MSGRGRYLRGSRSYRTPRSRLFSRNIGSLRGTVRRLMYSNGRSTATYRPRRVRWRGRKYYRKYKMYRRSVPSTRARTKAVNSGETGVSVNSSGSTTVVTVFPGNAFNHVNCAMGVMYLKLLPAPRFADQTTAGLNVASANQRRRNGNHVLYHGFKINRIFSLDRSGVQPSGPILVNYAIIQFQRNAYENVTATLPSAQNILKDFFRTHDDDEGTKDSKDFPGYGASSPWNHEINVLPMNPDNPYKIITHRKFVLTGKGGANEVNNATQAGAKMMWNMPFIKSINNYYKLMKIQSFTDVDSVNPETPFAEIWWYNSLTEDAKPADTTVSSSFYLNTFCKNQLYFSDTG